MNLRGLVISAFIILSKQTFVFSQEYSAGINTEDPSEYAVLHLVSPNGNQGLLIPTLTTSQRNSLSSLLGNNENGLMVYDDDLDQFYYWHDGSWYAISDDGDIDPTNENQTVSAGAGINVTQSGQDFQISNVLPDQIVALTSGGSGHLTISGTYPNFVLDVPNLDDADSDPLNEIQTLTKSGNTITLSNGGGSIDLASNIPAAGQTLEWDGSNWIPVTPPGAQTLSFVGTNLDILNGNSVDLSSLVNDADADPANENQTVSAGTGINVVQSGQDFLVTNSAPDQVITLADGGSGNAVIGGTYPNFTVDVPVIGDADADPANELQTISKSGNLVTLSNGGGSFTDEVNDADNDPVNENQTVSAGAGINVIQTGQNFQVANTLPDQVVNLTDGGSGHVVVGGVYPNLTVDVLSLDDADANPTNEIQVITAGSGITVTPSGNDYQIVNAAPDVPVNLSAASLNVSISGSYPNFILDVPSLNDADANPNNEIQDLDYTGNVLSLGGDPTPTSIDFSNWDMDVTDDFSTADETDPTVPGTIKDGIDWTEVSGKPAGFADDIDDVDDADNVIGNEIQDLSLSAAHSLSLSLSAATADLSPYMQTLSFTSPNLTVSGADGNTVDLSALNTDNQDLSLTGNTLSLTNDGTTVDLSGYLDNTDAQTVDQFDLTGATLNLSLLNDGAAPYTVDLSSFSIASQAGEGGNYLTTDGTVTSWAPLGTLAQLNTVTSAEIANGSVSEADLANSMAGDGLVGGAGTPLSVDLAANSGMDFLSNQLEMEELYPGGITYDGGASTAIKSITFDSKGRFVSATSVTVLLSSDRRLKKEITQLENSLEKITQLNGYNYFMKSDSLNKELKTGVMAQELQVVAPNLVVKRPDGYLAVDYQGLIPILIEAIKEQQAMIEDLRTEVDQQHQINQDQESRITAMEGKLDQLLKLIEGVPAP